MSLNSKQDDVNEINWMLIKYSVEFIWCDNKVSCDYSRRNSILGSSLQKNISLIEEKLGKSYKKCVSTSILLQLQRLHSLSSRGILSYVPASILSL